MHHHQSSFAAPQQRNAAWYEANNATSYCKTHDGWNHDRRLTAAPPSGQHQCAVPNHLYQHASPAASSSGMPNGYYSAHQGSYAPVFQHQSRFPPHQQTAPFPPQQQQHHHHHQQMNPIQNSFSSFTTPESNHPSHNKYHHGASTFPTNSEENISATVTDTTTTTTSETDAFQAAAPTSSSDPIADHPTPETYPLSTKSNLLLDKHTPLELKYLPETTLYNENYFRFRDYILGLYWGEDTNETDDDEDDTSAAENRKSQSSKSSNGGKDSPSGDTSMNAGKSHINFEARKFVTLQQVMVRLKKEHRIHMKLVYKFLHRFGYINVGIETPEYIQNQQINKQTDKNTESQKRVIIIGAGMSGLLAARQLKNFGYNVLILEGRDRIGGRAHSDEETGIDFGASILTGTVGNPATLFSKDLKMVPIKSDHGGLFDATDGSFINETYDQQIEQTFNSLLDKTCDYRNGEDGKEQEWKEFMSSVLTPEQLDDLKHATLGETLQHHIEDYLQKNVSTDSERQLTRRLMYWHVANLEYGLGTHVNNASLFEWDQDDEFDLGISGHYYYEKGYRALAEAICGNDLKIDFNRKVVQVDTSDPGMVRIHTTPNDNTILNPVHVTQQGVFDCKAPTHGVPLVYEADKVLVTASLGVLKSGTIQFHPPLPEWKRQSIQNLGFGLLNKVILFFRESFWEQQDYFGLVQQMNEYSKGYLVWNMQPATGKPILSCLVAGQAAIEQENDLIQNPHMVTDHIMQCLRRVYGQHIPNPERVALTRWRSDPYALGTYSYVSHAATGSDYDVMARSVQDRIYFAGEATCRTHPATVLGALLSGLREAGKIDAAFHPDDLCISSSQKKLKKSKRLSALNRAMGNKRKRGYKRSVFASRKRRRVFVEVRSERELEEKKKIRENVKNLPVIPKRKAKKKSNTSSTEKSVPAPVVSGESNRAGNVSTFQASAGGSSHPGSIQRSTTGANMQSFASRTQLQAGRPSTVPPYQQQHSYGTHHAQTHPHSTTHQRTQNQGHPNNIRPTSHQQSQQNQYTNIHTQSSLHQKRYLPPPPTLQSVRDTHASVQHSKKQTLSPPPPPMKRKKRGRRRSKRDGSQNLLVIPTESNTPNSAEPPSSTTTSSGLSVELENILDSMGNFGASLEQKPSESDKHQKKDVVSAVQQRQDLKSELYKIVTPILDSYLKKGHITGRDHLRDLRRRIVRKMADREKLGEIRKNKVKEYTKTWLDTKLKV